MRAELALSIVDSMKQRGLSVDAAAEIAGVEAERLRALVERRDLGVFDVDELGDVLEKIENSGPRFGMGRKP